MAHTPHTALRAPLLLAVAAAVGYMLSSALDAPTQELQVNTLVTLQATAALLLLAGISCLIHRPVLHATATDWCTVILFAGVTCSRLLLPGLAREVKYDDLMQAAMLYIALRVLISAERRTVAVLLILLFGFGIYEAWIGIRQVYGFAYSNHGLFKITGTLFNPGPYAGFLAPVFVCAVVCIRRSHRLAEWIFRSRFSWQRLRPVALICGLAPYLLGWGIAILTAIVLPATMSRAAWIAVAVGCGVLALRESGCREWLRGIYDSNPVRTTLLSGITLLLLIGAAAGAYWIKQPSADGRLLMWKIDARIMLHHPLCGVGLGNFPGAFGEEQAAYFASEERSQEETRAAGSPEAGFNEFLQFGAETGLVGFILLFLLTGTAVVNQVRRGEALGYGLLTAIVFACFSYPWSVLPLRLLFVILLAGVGARQSIRRLGRSQAVALLLLVGCLICWPPLYKRSQLRIDAHRQWGEVRIWMQSERYDYLIEDGARLHDILKSDSRFIYDYAYALHKTGDYQLSNEVLKQGMQLCCDPLYQNIAGRNHEALGDFHAAEQAYLQAHHMIPDRLYPLYLLTKLYISTGQTDKARTTAVKVMKHKPKIESPQTRAMQNEIRNRIDTLNLLSE